MNVIKKNTKVNGGKYYKKITKWRYDKSNSLK